MNASTNSEPALKLTDWNGTSDEDVVKCVLAGETALYEILIRRYNQRIYVWHGRFCGMTATPKT